MPCAVPGCKGFVLYAVGVAAADVGLFGDGVHVLDQALREPVRLSAPVFTSVRNSCQ